MNTFNPQNEKEPELFGEITDSRSGSGTVQAVPKTCYARKYVSAQRIREKYQKDTKINSMVSSDWPN